MGSAAWSFPRPAARFTASRNLSRATKTIRCVRSAPTASPSWRPRHTCFSTRRSTESITLRCATQMFTVRVRTRTARPAWSRFSAGACSRISPVTIYRRRRPDARLRLRRRRGAGQRGRGREQRIGRVQRRHRRRDQRQPALRGTRPHRRHRPGARVRSAARRANSGARSSRPRGRRTSSDGARRWSCRDGLAQTLRFFRDRAAR